MSVTMQQVLAQLDRDEPDYAKAAKLGRGVLPHLEQIVAADDPLRAAKAAYLATLIPDPEAIDVVKKAASHGDPQVRVAVAHGLRNAGDAAASPGDLIEILLGDNDSGVRKTALATVGQLKRSELRSKVEAIAKDDPEEFIRSAAADATRKLKAK